jgi:zeta-carotene desaturase
MRVAIVGAGLAGLSTAVDLVDTGHEVEIFESRPFMWRAKWGAGSIRTATILRWASMFFSTTTANLFALMKQVGAYDNLLPKDHVHTFINRGGDIGTLDFRFPIGGTASTA